MNEKTEQYLTKQDLEIQIKKLKRINTIQTVFIIIVVIIQLYNAIFK
jgi:hypothetical protein